MARRLPPARGRRRDPRVGMDAEAHSKEFDTAFERDGQLAVLSTAVEVRVLNISASGCLLETNCHMEPGTSGFMRVRIGEKEFGDEVRITRCIALEGAGSIHHAGAQFLWSRAPGERSLRRLVGNCEQWWEPRR